MGQRLWNIWEIMNKVMDVKLVDPSNTLSCYHQLLQQDFTCISKDSITDSQIWMAQVDSACLDAATVCSVS